MAPSISISDTTYALLTQLARPLEDTPDSLIASLAEAELRRRSGSSGRVSNAPADLPLRLEPDRHASLTHARLISASVDGTELHRPKWNGVLDHLHVLASKRLGSFAAVEAASSARLRPGRYEDEGYHYLPEADFSIQGLDANLAWDHSLGLARKLGVPIRVRFEWRRKKGAAHPGKLAVMEWTPSTRATA